MRILTLALLLICAIPKLTIAQDNVVHFSLWNPKPGEESQFEDGYHHHLQWHASSKDTWSWYGWYIISGPRDGQFLDATFGHAWSDFDHPVNPAGDAADNGLHTEPFGNFLTAYKAVRLPFSDPEDTVVLTSKFLRMLTIDVIEHLSAVELVKKLLTESRQKGQLDKALVYELVDGGRAGHLIVLLNAANFAGLGKTASWAADLLDLDHKSATHAIGGISAETLRFRRDMSILP